MRGRELERFGGTGLEAERHCSPINDQQQARRALEPDSNPSTLPSIAPYTAGRPASASNGLARQRRQPPLQAASEFGGPAAPRSSLSVAVLWKLYCHPQPG